jgi:tetratricopeptide (TPR) repeat protein
MHVYGTRDLERLLGVRASSVRALIRAGHVRPRKGARGKLQFSFQDLIILRTVKTLTGAKVSPRRLNRCLRQIRAALPKDVPLSGLAITAVGDEVAVREGRLHWNTESGQYLLALEVGVEAGGEVRLIAKNEPGAQSTAPEPPDNDSSPGNDSSGELYERGFELEEDDPIAALDAYQRCLAADRDNLDARVNCGRLLHLAGRLEEAERVYRGAPEPHATLLFNLAVLLEDLGRESEAIQAYRDVLTQEPEYADAHFNLARLHDLAGNQRESFRHLLAYKRASD